MKVVLGILITVAQLCAALVANGETNTGELRTRFESASRLYVYLDNNRDYEGERLFFEYLAQCRSKGEGDMLAIATVYFVHPAEARKLFGYLLNSRSDKVVADALEVLAARYAYTCEKKQLSIIRILAKRKEERIRASALYALKMIEETRGMGRNFYPDPS